MIHEKDILGPGISLTPKILHELSSPDLLTVSQETLQLLKQTLGAITSYLEPLTDSDPVSKSSRAYWTLEYVGAIGNALQSPDNSLMLPQETAAILQEICDTLLRSHAPSDQGQLLSPTNRMEKRSKVWERDQIANLVTVLQKRSVLFSKNLFDAILIRLMQQLNSSHANIRTKSLRTFASILDTDAHVLNDPRVKQVVQFRLIDHSSAVRETAVDMIGKYLVSGSKDILESYYNLVSVRIVVCSMRGRAMKFC